MNERKVLADGISLESNTHPLQNDNGDTHTLRDSGEETGVNEVIVCYKSLSLLGQVVGPTMDRTRLRLAVHPAALRGQPLLDTQRGRSGNTIACGVLLPMLVG